MTDFRHRDQYILHIPTKASLWKRETTFSFSLPVVMTLPLHLPEVPQEVPCKKWVHGICWLNLQDIILRCTLFTIIQPFGGAYNSTKIAKVNRKMLLPTLCHVRIL